MASVGRPKKLTDELIEKAKGYIETCKDEIHTTEKGAVAYVDVSLPSIGGMALYLGIHRDTIYQWCKENEVFSDIVSIVELEQEKRLLEKGLGGLYTSKALGALLSKHGYTEKTETDITTKGESINSPVLDEITEKLNALYKGTGGSSDGEPTSALGTQA